MLRYLAIVAGLLVAAGITVAGGWGGVAPTNGCSPTDRSFLQEVAVENMAVGVWQRQFIAQQDTASLAQVANATRARIASQAPTSPSLVRAQRFLNAMYREYATAAGASVGDRGKHIRLADMFANGAWGQIDGARAELAMHGCDVRAALGEA